MAGSSDLGPVETRCLLRRWQRTAPLGVLDGIIAADDELVLDQGAFGCCDASGLNPNGPFGRTERCGLRTRWARIESIFQDIQARERIGHSEIISNIDTDWHERYAELQAMFRGAKLGAAWRRSPKGPRRAWQYALMAIWYLGAEGKIISLKEAVRCQMNGVTYDWLASLGERRFIVIEGVCNLWDPLYSQMFEELLILCESHGFVTIVEVDRQAEPKGAASGAALGGMQGRVARMRKGASQRFMSERARGLLGRLCQWKEEDMIFALERDEDHGPQQHADGSTYDIGY